ncbi:DUF3306 domain-containing protein [Roseovarius sp. 2305UL8-3]|uniref:DUF3306 domain-containing protein n=1 Tax=Roseovarius conchicola TaxID=3121636 RepID=UPI003527F431
MNDFWSRRQAAVAEEVLAEQAAEVAETEAALAERDDAEILQELDLPQPEELNSPEAVREFMNSAVPQRLKTRALRRLWRLNPVLANLDGLVDYGEDFTDSATVIENMQTAYQVGKGMLAHVEALAAQAEEEANSDVEAPEGEDAPVEEDTEELLAEDEAEEMPVPVLTEEPAIAAYEFGEDEEPVLAAPRRRMTFQFETSA